VGDEDGGYGGSKGKKKKKKHAFLISQKGREQKRVSRGAVVVEASFGREIGEQGRRKELA